MCEALAEPQGLWKRFEVVVVHKQLLERLEITDRLGEGSKQIVAA